jgi:hypothetical protein
MTTPATTRRSIAILACRRRFFIYRLYVEFIYM